MTEVKMVGDINRTQEDHDLICRLVDHHEKLLQKLEELTARSYLQTETLCPDIYSLHKEIKEVFDFAQELKDY